MQTIYISTPINGQPGTKTLDEKIAVAKERIRKIVAFMPGHPFLKDYFPRSTFDVNEDGVREPEAMGNCIHQLMDAEAVLFDKGWYLSKGCRMEMAAARLYGKSIWLVDSEKDGVLAVSNHDEFSICCEDLNISTFL